jgi:hypothetical protein
VILDIIGLMTGSPLDPPRDPLVLGMFLEHFGLHARSPPPPSSNRRLLEDAAAAFSTLPYENLTKVLKRARSGSAEGARRAPLEVVSDHIAHGTGGTCFSLTAAFLHIARALGWRAEPILADRHYGADTHCALLVWVDGAPHLLDPGFLIHRPVPLDGLAETRISTGFNDVILAPRPGGEKVDLITVQDGVRSVRLTFKKEPVDPGRFLRVWDDSFSWENDALPAPHSRPGGEPPLLEGVAAPGAPPRVHLEERGGSRRSAGNHPEGVRARRGTHPAGPRDVRDASVTHVADPEPVKLLAAVLWREADALADALLRLRGLWGEVDFQGPDRPFDGTDYYEKEMGAGLQRRIISFTDLVPSDSLTLRKLEAAGVEEALRGPVGRRVNIDPGYLDVHKVVLASFKPGAPKVHLGRGVHADIVCRYSKGKFQPLEWSFGDFRRGAYDEELGAIRARYKGQLAAVTSSWAPGGSRAASGPPAASPRPTSGGARSVRRR